MLDLEKEHSKVLLCQSLKFPQGLFWAQKTTKSETKRLMRFPPISFPSKRFLKVFLFPWKVKHGKEIATAITPSVKLGPSLRKVLY
jgi:hypothetical protein